MEYKALIFLLSAALCFEIVVSARTTRWARSTNRYRSTRTRAAGMATLQQRLRGFTTGTQSRFVRAENGDNDQRETPIIIFPDHLDANMPNNVSIFTPASFNDLTAPSASVLCQVNDEGVLTFNVPVGMPTYIQIQPRRPAVSYTVRVKVLEFEKRFSVPGVPQNRLTLEIDRPIYKPGDTVKTRLYYFTKDLQALDSGTFKIALSGPDGTRRVEVARVAPNAHEFLRTPFELPNDAPEGAAWSVRAYLFDGTLDDAVLEQTTKAVQYFSVRRYTLPRFGVQVTSQTKYLLRNYRNAPIDLKILAKYAYGSMLNAGNVTLQAQALIETKPLTAGLLETSLDTTSLNLSTVSSVLVNIRVIDWITGETVNSTLTIRVSETPYKLAFFPMKPTLNRKFPFEIFVTYQDGSPAGGVPVEINVLVGRATAPSRRDRNISQHFETFTIRNVSSDAEGVVREAFNNTAEYFEAAFVGIRTSVIGVAEEQQAHFYCVVPAAANDSFNAYISIVPSKQTIQAGELLEAKIEKSGALRTLQYFLTCNNVLIKHDRLLDEVSLLQITTTLSMAPRCVLTVYGDVSGKRYFDAVRFNVKPVCNGKITTNKQAYSPAENVQITLRGGTNGIAAVNAIDRRLAYVNQTTRSTALFQNSPKASSAFDFLYPTSPNAIYYSDQSTPFGLSLDLQLIRTFCRAAGERHNYYKSDSLPHCEKPSMTGFFAVDECSRAWLGGCVATTSETGAATAAQTQTGSGKAPLNVGQVASVRMQAGLQATPENSEESPDDVAARTESPESWIFDDFFLPNGVATVNSTIPTSITNWTLNAAFFTPGEGLCLAPSTEISAFKKTFLVVVAPDFAFVGEQIEMRVYAYTYERHQGTHFSICHTVPDQVCAATDESKPLTTTAIHAHGINPTLEKGYDFITIPLEFMHEGEITFDFYLVGATFQTETVCTEAGQIYDRIRKTISVKSRDEIETYVGSSVVRLDDGASEQVSNELFDMADTTPSGPGLNGQQVLRVKVKRAGVKQIKLKFTREMLRITDDPFVERILAGTGGDEDFQLYRLEDVLKKAFRLFYAADYLRSLSENDGATLAQIEALDAALQNAMAKLRNFYLKNFTYTAVQDSYYPSLWLNIAATDMTALYGLSDTLCSSMQSLLDLQDRHDGSFFSRDEIDGNSASLWLDKDEYRQVMTAAALVLLSDYANQTRFCKETINRVVARSANSAVGYLMGQRFSESGTSVLALAASTFAVSLWQPDRAQALNAFLVNRAKDETASTLSWTYKEPTTSMSVWQRFWRKVKKVFGANVDGENRVVKEMATNAFGLLAQTQLQNPLQLKLEKVAAWLSAQKSTQRLMEVWPSLRATVAFSKLAAYRSFSAAAQSANISVVLQCPTCTAANSSAHLTQRDPKALTVARSEREFLVVLSGTGSVRVAVEMDAIANRTADAVNNTAASAGIQLRAELSGSTLHVCFRFSNEYKGLLGDSLMLRVDALTQYELGREPPKVTNGTCRILSFYETKYRTLDIRIADMDGGGGELADCVQVKYTPGTYIGNAAPAAVELWHQSEGLLATTYYLHERNTPIIRKFCSNSSSCTCTSALCHRNCSTALWSDTTTPAMLKDSLCRDNKSFAWKVEVERSRPSETNPGYRLVTVLITQIFKPTGKIGETQLVELDLIQKETCDCPRYTEMIDYYLIGNTDRFVQEGARYGYFLTVYDTVQTTQIRPRIARRSAVAEPEQDAVKFVLLYNVLNQYYLDRRAGRDPCA